MKRNAIWTFAVAAVLASPVSLVQPARAAFEEIEESPRARALGSTWAALSADPYAVFHNPASLAWAGRASGSASYLRPFGYDFSSQATLAGSAALPHKWGGLGFGIRRFGVDFQDKNLARELTVAIAHGFHLLSDVQSQVATGWALNVYSLEFGPSVTGIDPGSATSVGLNVGAVAVVRERTRVGFQAQNINNPNIGKRDKEELRRRVMVGFSYSPYPGVETVLGIANELGENVQYRGGAEFQVADFLWLRTGMRSEPNVFSAGLGLMHAGLTLDYGFSTGGGVLDETHHIGIRYVLPERK